jgi:hypothetical protein
MPVSELFSNDRSVTLELVLPLPPQLLSFAL